LFLAWLDISWRPRRKQEVAREQSEPLGWKPRPLPRWAILDGSPGLLGWKPRPLRPGWAGVWFL